MLRVDYNESSHRKGCMSLTGGMQPIFLYLAGARF